MKYSEAKEIVEILSGKRYVFRYFKDRYALMLLDYLLKDDVCINELKKTNFNRLLDKDIIKSVCAICGKNILIKDYLKYFWGEQDYSFPLTIGLWGMQNKNDYWCRSWDQMARKGANIVLQMNFSRQHDRRYEHLIKPEGKKPFVYTAHPVNQKDRNTLAWARIDMDLYTGEALIEEIQNDWIRRALNFSKRYKNVFLKEYVNSVLNPYEKIWSEAMLAAAIDFLYNEIGIKKIFYYTSETGNFLKGLDGYSSRPPVSLYEKLPKKFCFQKTENAPEFIMKERGRFFRKKIKGRRLFFYNLNLSRGI